MSNSISDIGVERADKSIMTKEAVMLGLLGSANLPSLI